MLTCGERDEAASSDVRVSLTLHYQHDVVSQPFSTGACFRGDRLTIPRCIAMKEGSSDSPSTTPRVPRLHVTLGMARGAPPPFMSGKFRCAPYTAQRGGVVLPTALTGPPPKAALPHSPATSPTARAGASAWWYCRDTGIECVLAPRTAWWTLPSKAAPPIQSEPAPGPAPEAEIAAAAESAHAMSSAKMKTRAENRG